jgi:hypothetical protein
VKAWCVEALNVKTAVFFLAFLPQFVDVVLPLVPQFVVLGSICVMLNTAVDVAVVLGASAALARWHSGVRFCARGCSACRVRRWWRSASAWRCCATSAEASIPHATAWAARHAA